MDIKRILLTLSKLSRQLGLIQVSDSLHYYAMLVLTYKARKSFKQEYSQIPIPPDYALYETYKLDYRGYYFGGMESAKWVVSVIEKYKETRNIKVLDWGCGVGRVLRHLPGYLNESCSIHGTDYNALILTLHGDAFRSFLSKNDREKYDKGELVVNANTKIGHRTFGAFHPSEYISSLIGENIVLEHVKGGIANGKSAQDVWVIKKAQ